MSRHPVESPAVLSQLGATGSATTWCGNTMSIAYSQSTAAGMAAASLLMPVPSVCINPLRGIRDGGNRKRQGRGALFDWDNAANPAAAQPSRTLHRYTLASQPSNRHHTGVIPSNPYERDLFFKREKARTFSVRAIASARNSAIFGADTHRLVGSVTHPRCVRIYRKRMGLTS
jgi:hypothetical protein